MKFLLLVIVLCLGYASYVHWEQVAPVLTEARTKITKITSASAPAATPSEPIPSLTTRPGVGPGTPRQTPLASLVAESQRVAVAKYPALSVVNSEMNSRFVFRYKRLLAEHDARLQDPNWPVQLADECATASGVRTQTVATGKGTR